MEEITQSHELKDFTKGAKTDIKFDKTPQLTPEMSIDPSSRDSFESEIHTLGGR